MILLCLGLLPGCTLLCGEPRVVTRTVEVQVPVPVRADAPAELTAPPDLPMPAFVLPAHPDATSAVTAEGETRLRGMLLELFARERAWRAWAAGPDDRESR